MRSALRTYAKHDKHDGGLAESFTCTSVKMDSW